MLVRLLELIRFSHTLFALPFAILSAAMAWAADFRAVPPRPFRWLDLLGILLCMATARGAAMAFNRLADRRLDALNPRTCTRHLPSGILTVRSVVLLTVICAAGFVGGTLLFLPRNFIPFLASLPVLAFLFGYSFSKRFTIFTHFWLGAALMLAPLGAWVAIRGALSFAPLVLGGAVLLWVAGFDIIYACQDYTFDVVHHLYSVPAKYGIAKALRIASLCHFGMVLLLAFLPLVYDGFGAIYYAGLLGITLLLAYEHYLVRPDDLSRVEQAFFHVNAVVSIGLMIVGMADLFFGG